MDIHMHNSRFVVDIHKGYDQTMRKAPLFFQLDMLNGGHENCRHNDYAMSCQDYELLLHRSNGHCELCGLAGLYNQWRKLHIDHDCRVGMWGVRGLLCYMCNTHMFNPKVVDPNRLKPFLEQPFWRGILARAGAPDRLDEPPIGSSVRDASGRTWTRDKRGWTPNAYRWQSGCRDWHWLHYKNGPHILGQHLRVPA